MSAPQVKQVQSRARPAVDRVPVRVLEPEFIGRRTLHWHHCGKGKHWSEECERVMS